MITDKKPQFVYSVAAVHMIFDVFLKSSNFASSHSYVGEIFPSLEQWFLTDKNHWQKHVCKEAENFAQKQREDR